jgi:hypothetical protein
VVDLSTGSCEQDEDREPMYAFVLALRCKRMTNSNIGVITCDAIIALSYSKNTRVQGRAVAKNVL